MKVLFLDDNKNRIDAAIKLFNGDDLFVAKAASEAILYLSNLDNLDLVMLDHDLGGEAFVDSDREDCGMEVVRWILRTKPKIKRIVIHSWNVPASNVMVSMLGLAGYSVAYKPFAFNISESEG
ncbi:hypothetical protein LCGC14_1928330 [marine sediment metagenome]|uniref:Cyclic-phosphate processing Receiver domain-containing protein n=1 Tax=marine sediment metagenome TaxID=412755 RepID=A0A0F9FP86_9ZZZZ